MPATGIVQQVPASASSGAAEPRCHRTRAPARSPDNVAGQARRTETERLLTYRAQRTGVQRGTMRDLQPVNQTPRVDKRQRATAPAWCDERRICPGNIAADPALVLVVVHQGVVTGSCGSLRRRAPAVPEIVGSRHVLFPWCRNGRPDQRPGAAARRRRRRREVNPPHGAGVRAGVVAGRTSSGRPWSPGVHQTTWEMRDACDRSLSRTAQHAKLRLEQLCRASSAAPTAKLHASRTGMDARPCLRSLLP